MALVLACLGVLQFATPGLCLVQKISHKAHGNSINAMQQSVHQIHDVNDDENGEQDRDELSEADWEFQNQPKSLPPDDDEEAEEFEEVKDDEKEGDEQNEGKDTEEEDDEEEFEEEKDSSDKKVNGKLVQVKRRVIENKFTEPAPDIDKPVVRMIPEENETNTSNTTTETKTETELGSDTKLGSKTQPTPNSEMQPDLAEPVMAVSTPSTQTKSTYVLTWYGDNICHRPHASRADTIMTTDKPGCYRIMAGEMSGSSFLLDCPAGNAEQVSQRIYNGDNCEGDPLKKRYMEWRLFKGKCQKHQKIAPPLRHEDFPPCKKEAGVVQEAIYQKRLGECDCSWAKKTPNTCAEATNDGSHCFTVCCAGALNGHLPPASNISWSEE